MSLAQTYLSVKELLANNITAKGVNASSTDGLTTLSNKVLDIKTNQFFTLDSDADLDTDTDYVLDETIPRPQNPTRKIAVSIFEKFVENIKNKPDSERNVIDYAVLLFDKLRKLNPKMYVAS
jgi:hypothetical protein